MRNKCQAFQFYFSDKNITDSIRLILVLLTFVPKITFTLSSNKSNFPSSLFLEFPFLNKKVAFSIMSAYFPEYQSHSSFQHASLNLISTTFYFIIPWPYSLNLLTMLCISRSNYNCYSFLWKEELRSKILDVFIYYANLIITSYRVMH